MVFLAISGCNTSLYHSQGGATLLSLCDPDREFVFVYINWVWTPLFSAKLLKRNCYRLSHVSWALAQIFCILCLQCETRSPVQYSELILYNRVLVCNVVRQAQVSQAQAASQAIVYQPEQAPPPYTTTPPYAGSALYPSLSDYMGLEITDDMISRHAVVPASSRQVCWLTLFLEVVFVNDSNRHMWYHC